MNYYKPLFKLISIYIIMNRNMIVGDKMNGCENLMIVLDNCDENLE